MRPCDCKDQYSVEHKLREAGIGLNNNSITVKPCNVILNVGPVELRIPQRLFKIFAEWYLEDQGTT